MYLDRSDCTEGQKIHLMRSEAALELLMHKAAAPPITVYATKGGIEFEIYAFWPLTDPEINREIPLFNGV